MPKNKEIHNGPNYQQNTKSHNKWTKKQGGSEKEIYAPEEGADTGLFASVLQVLSFILSPSGFLLFLFIFFSHHSIISYVCTFLTILPPQLHPSGSLMPLFIFFSHYSALIFVNQHFFPIFRALKAKMILRLTKTTGFCALHQTIGSSQ